MVTILRPLSTSELLDRTFHLHRNNFFLFVGITAIAQLVVLALHFVDSAAWLGLLVNSQALRTLFFLSVSFIAIEVSHAATVNRVSSLHLFRIATMGARYNSVKASLLRVLGITSVAFVVPLVLAIGLGVLLVGVSARILAATGAFLDVLTPTWMRVAILPVVFLVGPLLALRCWLRWSLVVPVTVIEGGGLRASMRRSRSLTEGRHGRILVTYVLVFLVTWTLAILFQMPFYLMVTWKYPFPLSRGSAMALIVSAVGSFLSTSLVGPLLEIAFTLIYYDERVRREGFDLQLMISALKSAAQPAPAPVS